jgi:ribosomal protein S18 acetylase RimI-like enzyme
LQAPVDIQIVDLSTVKPAELEDLWQYEMGLWRERLLWDVSDSIAMLRRLVERGVLPGKAVRVDDRTVGYVQYGIAGRFGVISTLVVSPDCSATGVGEMLLEHGVEVLRRQGVSRIESQYISFDCPWLAPAFEHAGFCTYWREFLRLDVQRSRSAVNSSGMVSLEPWGEADLHGSAAILQAAYHGGIEAEIHARYQTTDGCQDVLENLLYQGSCGGLVAKASAMARHRGRSIGFLVVTELAPRQGHVAQVAVLPEYQRRGIGQRLLDYGVSRLAACQFDTLSLTVSRANDRALRLYQAMGFRTVLAFPVFLWEG